MGNLNFLATLGSSQKNLSKSHGQRTSPRSLNIGTSYLQILQNTLFNRSMSRNNSQAGHSTSYNVSHTENFLSSGNPYVSDPREKILMGDANNDGVVDNNDLELLQLNVIGLGNIKNFRAADMDGDGEITVTDVSKLNLKLKEQNPPVSKIKGDVNGDGKIDVVNDAVTVSNYFNGKIQKNDFLYDNADVTGDGKVDLTDAETIRAFANGEINSLNPYQTWESVAKIKLPVYTDGHLSTRSGNEEVWAGDKVTVLNENDKAYFIRYPVSNGYKERWVSKTIFDEPVPPPVVYPYDTNIGDRAVWTFIDENLTNHFGNDVVTSRQNITIIGENEKAFHITYKNSVGETLDRWMPKNYPAQYQTWEATATGYKAAFTDENLSNRIGNEAVYSGDKVTILDERDNSYLVRYPSKNGYKDRWVSKTDIVPYVEPQIDPIEKNVIERLDRYIDGSMGNYWKVNTKWTGGYQCRGFAQQLYSKIFGVGSITGYANKNYSASSFPGSYESGRLFDFGTSDTDSVRRLFTENARPGAFVQMGRRNSLNSDGTAPGPHSAIVHKIDSDGVWFYEANARGTGMITEKKYTWQDLANQNKGFTIYLPKNYR